MRRPEVAQLLRRAHRARVLRLAGCYGILLVGAAARLMAGASPGADDWPAYGHDPGGMRFSPLDAINRENVTRLKVAWVFHTGDISDGKGSRKRSGFETTPLIVEGTLYLTTPSDLTEESQSDALVAFALP